MRIAGRIVPAAVPELLFEDRAAGARGHGLSRPGALPAVERGAARRARPSPPWPAAVGDRLGRIHAATARRPDIAAQFPDRRHLPRHPARALSAGHRPWRIPALAPAVAADGAAHGHDQARPGPWRRQPEEHPARPRRPGVPRRRVRLVRRSRVRPRLLPQPPAAQVPVDARCRAGLPRLLRRAGGRAISRRCDWEPRGRARGAGGGPAARPVPGPHRRQVAGRVRDRAGRQGAGAADGQRVPAGARRTAWPPMREAWAVELGL